MYNKAPIISQKQQKKQRRRSFQLFQLENDTLSFEIFLCEAKFKSENSKTNVQFVKQFLKINI